MNYNSKDTICVHTGTYFDETTRGVNTPVFTSSASGYIDQEENVYPRYFNTPNQKAIIEKISALEGGEDGLVLSSGMAAISAVMFTFLQKGDHVILQSGLYGGTHHFVTTQFPRFGIEYSFVNAEDIGAFERELRGNTKVVYLETPSNPLLSITDIKRVASFCKNNNLVTIIDNTFATPINQNPILLGIDIVIHSGTKYLSGHSDICFGAIVSSKEKIKAILKRAIDLGGSLNAQTCYLIERSLKTLSLRVARQNDNALTIAQHLQRHAKVKEVFYPGLESHKGYSIAKSQMKGFGGMLSFELTEEINEPNTFLRNLKLVMPAVSLGGVETIICSPAMTSHVKMSREDRIKAGITDKLLRLSVGVEDAGDLVRDLDQALERT